MTEKREYLYHVKFDRTFSYFFVKSLLYLYSSTPIRMKHFLAEIYLEEIPTYAFYDVIPRHRAFISDLLNRGVITSYSVANNRGKIWITFMGHNTQDVDTWITQFPILQFIGDYKINELLFHDSAYAGLPAISLN